jgi:PAS domain S-box-containing protein
MMLDAFTGIVASFLLCSSISCAMLLLWRYVIQRQALQLWGVGIGCFALAAALILLRPVLPLFVTITISNLIFSLAYCFLWAGVSAYRNRPPRTTVMVIITLVFIPLNMWFTYINPLISMRIVVQQFFGVLFLVCIVRTILSTTDRLTFTEKFTIAALVLDITMLTATIAVQLIYLEYNPPVLKNVISAAYSLLSLITVTSFGLAFLLMVLEQMYNEVCRAERETRSAKTLLDMIIDNIPSYTYLKNRQGRLLVCSQGLADYFGVTKEQAIGRTGHELFPPALADRQAADDQAVFSSGMLLKTEECIESDNDMRYFETIKLPLKGADGAVSFLCGISTDITERKQAEHTLNETSERFMRLLDTVSTVAVQGYELDGTVVYWNKASESLYGFTAEEALGGNLLELIIPPEMHEEVRQAVRYMKETGDAIPAGELTLLRKDGSRVSVHSSHALVQTGTSTPVLFCLDIDLSERMLMEEKLQQSSDEWRRTFDTIPDMITIVDHDHRIVRANRATWENLGCEVQDLLGKSCHSLFHGTDSKPDYCPHVRALRDGKAHSSEIFDPKTHRHFNVTVTPLHVQNGNVTACIHVAHDITTIKLTEHALRASEFLFKESQRAASIGSYHCDFNADSWESSEVLDQIFGIGPDYVRNVQGWLDIVHHDDREMMERYLNKEVISNRSRFSKGYRIIRTSDGETRWVHGCGELGFDTEGNVVSMIGVIQDITEQKRVEDELNRKNFEVEQFLYTVSHDLRTPLVTVKTFMGYLEKDMVAGNRDQLAQDIMYINSAAEKMKLLLDELLEFSRIDRVGSPPVTITFRDILNDVLDILAGAITERAVHVQLPDTDLMLFGDYPRLCQLWQNLVENAIKYSRDGVVAAIDIGWQQEHGETVFFVRDNGIGIDTRYHGKIFGVFEKLEPKSPGAGLGLSMVKRIVEKNGGRIWVESDGEGTGSCFRFTLPFATDTPPKVGVSKRQRLDGTSVTSYGAM